MYACANHGGAHRLTRNVGACTQRRPLPQLVSASRGHVTLTRSLDEAETVISVLAPELGALGRLEADREVHLWDAVGLQATADTPHSCNAAAALPQNRQCGHLCVAFTCSVDANRQSMLLCSQCQPVTVAFVNSSC